MTGSNHSTDPLEDFYGEAGYLLRETMGVEQYNLTSSQVGPFWERTCARMGRGSSKQVQH